jgi:transcriptional regulator with XRE-family HTH domain
MLLLGDRIRELREARGLSRDALASKVGLSAIYIRKLEDNERTSPSFPVLERLARALGVRVRLELR